MVYKFNIQGNVPRNHFSTSWLSDPYQILCTLGRMIIHDGVIECETGCGNPFPRIRPPQDLRMGGFWASPHNARGGCGGRAASPCTWNCIPALMCPCVHVYCDMFVCWQDLWVYLTISILMLVYWMAMFINRLCAWYPFRGKGLQAQGHCYHFIIPWLSYNSVLDNICFYNASCTHNIVCIHIIYHPQPFLLPLAVYHLLSAVQFLT